MPLSYGESVRTSKRQLLPHRETRPRVIQCRSRTGHIDSILYTVHILLHVLKHTVGLQYAPFQSEMAPNVYLSFAVSMHAVTLDSLPAYASNALQAPATEATRF